ncbi:hypothetical protein [Variovorax sp. MHTC-1]|uniref:hypothetical protein n=1 Tax=Variovorax sp. MHTC-1 TaxID=2495593 RepID=UPI001C8DD1F4|nr:hypothetical protein [Variovorax sp. MHTC-1]
MRSTRMPMSADAVGAEELRVTLVYRRDGAGEWELAHRHADPLVHGIDLGQAAAIARGSCPPTL